ncbi:S1C family serine protease [Lachnospiraceae bacterium 62-35]
MPDMNGPGSELPKKKKFISERIVKQPMSRRQKLKRAAVFLFLAVMFGVIAAITFVLSIPFAKKYMGEESTKESQVVSIPKDEETSPTEPVLETMENETAPINELVEEAMSNYHFDMAAVTDIYNNLKQEGQKAGKSIVEVRAVKRGTDWFDNPIENTGQYAGAIIAGTNSELLILVPNGAIEPSDAIYVTFYDGTEIEGRKKQADKITGLGIISVQTSDIPDDKLEAIQPFKLGNSYMVRTGDLVFSIGAPTGVPYSFDYGAVNYVAKNVQTTDGIAEIIFANVRGNAEAGTFLLNISGEIIGWVTDRYQSDTNQDSIIAEGISDYKGILEKMSNGIPAAYLGVKGQEITSEMAAEGVPEGIYVTESIFDGPAYTAGIQNGDIISAIDGDSVFTMKAFQTKIEGLKERQPVKVVVNRKGMEEYTELIYQVIMGER